MTLAPASDFDLAALAAVFTAGYEGYFVPLHVDEAAVRFMVDAWDIDLGRSRVAFEAVSRSVLRFSPCAASRPGSAASASHWRAAAAASAAG